MNSIDHEDTAFHEHLRATLHAVARTTSTDRFDVVARSAQRRRPLAIWAPAAALIILAGTGLWIRADSDSTPTRPAASAPLPVAMLVPTALADGQVLYTGTKQGPIASDSGEPYVPWADRVYAPAAGFNSPRQLLGVTTGVEFCPGSENETVDINGHVASVCSDFYDITALSWQNGNDSINVVGGGLTTMAQVVQFAEALDKSANVTDNTTVPDGWTLLSDNRNFVTAESHQVVYTVGPDTTAEGVQYIELRIWSHVPDTALYAIGYPLTGESITVRGVPAIIDIKEPDNVFLFWIDPTGVVISLQAYGGDRQTAIDFANGLHATGQAGFDSFLGSGVAPPFALPRDARGEDGQPSDTVSSGG